MPECDTASETTLHRTPTALNALNGEDMDLAPQTTAVFDELIANPKPGKHGRANQLERCSNTALFANGSQVCTRAFRAEPSHGRLHAAEFWMLELEFCFASLEDNIKVNEGCIKFCIKFCRQ